jgi:hypothetical protein
MVEPYFTMFWSGDIPRTTQLDAKGHKTESAPDLAVSAEYRSLLRSGEVLLLAEFFLQSTRFRRP